jgi:antitoxin component of MazEF toxin-antitoxin module
MKLEAQRVGKSTGLILPKGLSRKPSLAQGDWLDVTENTNGSVRL